MKLEKIEVTPEQIISVNQAIYLLLESKAPTGCIAHLIELQKTMGQAKIIKGVGCEV